MKKLAFLALCLVTGCADKDAECTEDEVACDGTIVQACVDGAWVDDTDCADDGMMCHEEMGHCMAMDDSGM